MLERRTSEAGVTPILVSRDKLAKSFLWFLENIYVIDFINF